MLQIDARTTRYIREYSARDLLRTTASLYIKHFGVFFTIAMLGLLVGVAAFVICIMPGVLAESDFLLVVGGLIGYVALFLVNFAGTAAQTVAVSEATLGHRPNIVRAFRHVLGATTGKLLVTSALMALALFAGFLMLVVPGVLFMVWFALTPPVVVLENKWGGEALRRSMELGRGYYKRILGVYLAALMVILVISYFLTLPFVLVDSDAAGIILFFEIPLFPVVTILLVLLYYDLRVRKEGYDLASLSEDLSH